MSVLLQKNVFSQRISFREKDLFAKEICFFFARNKILAGEMTFFAKSFFCEKAIGFSTETCLYHEQNTISLLLALSAREDVN